MCVTMLQFLLDFMDFVVTYFKCWDRWYWFRLWYKRLSFTHFHWINPICLCFLDCSVLSMELHIGYWVLLNIITSKLRSVTPVHVEKVYSFGLIVKLLIFTCCSSYWTLWISTLSFNIGIVDINSACDSSSNGWQLCEYFPFFVFLFTYI